MFGNPYTFSVSVGTTQVPLCTLLPTNVFDTELIVTADPANTGNIYLGSTGVTAGTTRATDGMPILPGKTKPYYIKDPRTLFARSNSGTNLIYVEANY